MQPIMTPAASAFITFSIRISRSTAGLPAFHPRRPLRDRHFLVIGLSLCPASPQGIVAPTTGGDPT
jgi:hypothetical protein